MAARHDEEPPVPEGAVTEQLADVVDPNEFTPRLISLLSNALVWRESSLLREEFDLGTNDWRVISAIATRPGISANAVASFLGMNKALISKSVTVLQGRGLVVFAGGRRGLKHLYLTERGAEMHHAMRPISVSGQELIAEGLHPDELEAFNATLRDMLDRIRRAQSDGDGPPG